MALPGLQARWVQSGRRVLRAQESPARPANRDRPVRSERKVRLERRAHWEQAWPVLSVNKVRQVPSAPEARLARPAFPVRWL
jgi:hypothetical protein